MQVVMGDTALSRGVPVETWPAFAFGHRGSHKHVDAIWLLVAFLFWEGAATWVLGAQHSS